MAGSRRSRGRGWHRRRWSERAARGGPRKALTRMPEAPMEWRPRLGCETWHGERAVSSPPGAEGGQGPVRAIGRGGRRIPATAIAVLLDHVATHRCRSPAGQGAPPVPAHPRPSVLPPHHPVRGAVLPRTLGPDRRGRRDRKDVPLAAALDQGERPRSYLAACLQDPRRASRSAKRTGRVRNAPPQRSRSSNVVHQPVEGAPILLERWTLWTFRKHGSSMSRPTLRHGRQAGRWRRWRGGGERSRGALRPMGRRRGRTGRQGHQV